MPALAQELTALPLFPIQARNQVADSFFYDVDALTPEEKAGFSRLIDREGTMIVVPPSKDGDRKILHYSSGLRFINHESQDISTIVVSGVGSSVLGTAAFARAVADAIGKPVAGLVSGYGMLDLVTEGLGGWFFYGMVDRSKLELKGEMALSKSRGTEMPAFHAEGKNKRGLVDAARNYFVLSGWTDTGTLLDILMARPEKLNLLVGHSKGCLIIDYVLSKLAEELEEAEKTTGAKASEFFKKKIDVVTLGAVVNRPDNLPEAFQYHQFLGELDVLGRINSSSDRKTKRVMLPGTGHHLNPNADVPFGPRHINIKEVLEKVRVKVG